MGRQVVLAERVERRAECNEVIAQRDQYIAQLQQENAYLRAELEAAQRRLGTTGP